MLWPLSPYKVPSVLTANQDTGPSTLFPRLTPLSAYQKLYIFRWHRALCKVTAPHTSVFGSPQVAQISEKMSTLPGTVTKCRLTEGVRGPQRSLPLLLLLSWQNGPAGNSLHTRERESGDTSEGRAGCRQKKMGVGWCWRGANTLKPLEVMSSLLRLKDSVWICWPLIWHQYLCPHLCFLSLCTIRACLSASWQCPFTSCYCTLGAAVSRPSLSFFVSKSGLFSPLMHSLSVGKWRQKTVSTSLSGNNQNITPVEEVFTLWKISWVCNRQNNLLIESLMHRNPVVYTLTTYFPALGKKPSPYNFSWV